MSWQMHGSRGLLIAALVLMGIGLVGGAVSTAVVGSDLRWRMGSGQADRSGDRSGNRVPDAEGFASNGERIYYTGIGHAGPIQTEWDPSGGSGGYGGMMGRRRGGRQQGNPRIGCVRCHREDGRGGPVGMMGGGTEAPDIRYSTLVAGDEPGEDETESAETGWSDDDIARAIREGIEPDGEVLDPLMPRWRMDATDVRDTIDYLKELSER